MMMYVAPYEDHIFPVFKRESIIIRTPSQWAVQIDAEHRETYNLCQRTGLCNPGCRRGDGLTLTFV